MWKTTATNQEESALLSSRLKLDNVLYVPQLIRNSIFVTQLIDLGNWVVQFTTDISVI